MCIVTGFLKVIENLSACEKWVEEEIEQQSHRSRLWLQFVIDEDNILLNTTAKVFYRKAWNERTIPPRRNRSQVYKGLMICFPLGQPQALIQCWSDSWAREKLPSARLLGRWHESHEDKPHFLLFVPSRLSPNLKSAYEQHHLNNAIIEKERLTQDEQSRQN